MAERKPSLYIPTLYFAEGLPYTIVMMMSGVFFKSLGATNVFVGLTTALSLPWTIKFLWAPLVDFTSTKRRWILGSQLGLVATCVFLAGASMLPDAITGSVVVLAVMALISATHDVAIDGYYLDVLDARQQAFYVGVRNAFYRVAWLFAAGGMVYAAGEFGRQLNNLQAGWALAYLIIAAALVACFFFHLIYLPSPVRRPAEFDMEASSARQPATSGVVGVLYERAEVAPALANSLTSTTATGRAEDHDAVDSSPSASNPSDQRNGSSFPDRAAGSGSGREPVRHGLRRLRSAEFLNAIVSYFRQPGAIFIVAYILLFRLGDALLMKQAPLFLLDPADKGGMGVSVQDVGIICGTVGVGALLAGGLVGGWLVSRFGLRHWFVPLALIQNAAILLYWLLALYHPSIGWLYLANGLENLAYGLGVAAYTVFLLKTVRSDFRAAHYAVATGLMALGIQIPGIASGYLCEGLGYANFFLASFLLSIPGMVCIFFLPLWRDRQAA